MQLMYRNHVNTHLPGADLCILPIINGKEQYNHKFGNIFYELYYKTIFLFYKNAFLKFLRF